MNALHGMSSQLQEHAPETKHPLRADLKAEYTEVHFRQSIPRKIHLIWCGRKMPDYALGTVQHFCTRAKRSCPPYSVNLWVDRRSQYEQTRALHPEYVDMEKVGILKLRELSELDSGVQAAYTPEQARLYRGFTARDGVGLECQAARADIYRLEILRQEGGVYSDMDADFYPWMSLARQFVSSKKVQQQYLEYYCRKKLKLYSAPKPFRSWELFFEAISESPQKCREYLGRESLEALEKEVLDYIVHLSTKELELLTGLDGLLVKKSDLNLRDDSEINNNLIAALPEHGFLNKSLAMILQKYADDDSITQRKRCGHTFVMDEIDIKRFKPINILDYSGPWFLSHILFTYYSKHQIPLDYRAFRCDSSYIALTEGKLFIEPVIFAGIRDRERSFHSESEAHGKRSWNKKKTLISFEV